MTLDQGASEKIVLRGQQRSDLPVTRNLGAIHLARRKAGSNAKVLPHRCDCDAAYPRAKLNVQAGRMTVRGRPTRAMWAPSRFSSDDTDMLASRLFASVALKEVGKTLVNTSYPAARVATLIWDLRGPDNH